MARVVANGILIEVEVDGPADGVPTLLIPGFGAQLVGWDREFVDLLAGRGLRVVRLDNRDAGLSEGFDGAALPSAGAVARGEARPPYTLADMARDAVGVLDALGIESAHVCGRSMGGMIAQLVALDHPDRVRSLISVYSTTGAADLPGAEPNVLAALVAPPASSHEERVAAGVAWARLVGGTLPLDEERARRRTEMAEARAFRPDGARRQRLALAAERDRTGRLAALDLPTLVLHGSEDPLIPPAAGRATAEAIPGARYVELSGMGHDLHPLLWDRITGLIGDFVTEVESARHR